MKAPKQNKYEILINSLVIVQNYKETHDKIFLAVEKALSVSEKLSFIFKNIEYWQIEPNNKEKKIKITYLVHVLGKENDYSKKQGVLIKRYEGRKLAYEKFIEYKIVPNCFVSFERVLADFLKDQKFII